MSNTTPKSTQYAFTSNYFDDILIHNWRELLAIESELLNIGALFETFNIKHILSIGCGNGLFERIIQDCLGVALNGIEVDRSWWESKYAIKSFININYIDDCKKGENLEKYLQKCCNLENWNFSLMFCYFNNRAAFLNYIEMYKGNILLIIGPKTGVNVFTEPLPLEPRLPEGHRWKLKATLNIGKLDVIAFYTKDV
nr:uncharacterized protein LOC106618968 isoform X2 [Bactrocera oleae]